jgi:hypothetical protein
VERYGIDINRLDAIDAVPEDVRDLLVDNIDQLRASGVGTEFAAEVAIDADGLVRETVYHFPLGAIMGGGEMEALYRYSDFGAPLDLDIPKKSDTVPFEDVVPAG